MPGLPDACQRDRRWKTLALFAMLAVGCWPAPCRAADNAPTAGYLRSRYSQFRVLLFPVKPNEQRSVKEQSLLVDGVNGRAAVPPGEYYILNWKVEADDKAGHHWYAKGNSLPDPITIRAGEETKVRLADPLQGHLIVYGDRNPLGFRMELTGPYGERCREIRMDDHYMPPQKFEILDEKGRLVERVTFQGRCGGTCLTLWPAPPGLKGRFIARPDVDLGPLPVDVGAGVAFTLDAAQLTIPSAQVGEPAPDFLLVGTDATMAQLSFMRGRPVILSFFCACGLCKAVATELGKRPDLAKRARLVAIFSDPAFAEAPTSEAFLKETGYPGKLLLDLGASVTLQYRSPHCPRLWTIDGSGVARHATPDASAPAAKIIDDAVAALSTPKAPAKPVQPSRSSPRRSDPHAQRP